MIKYIFSFILLSSLQFTTLDAAVSILGSTDAATCYNHAKQGYSSRSSINTMSR